VTLVTLAASILVFGLLILAHEFGHFIVAKRAGIKVTAFAIGFGPPLVRWQRGETTYSLRLFPIGGYVLMAGTDPEEPVTEDGFNAKSVGWRSAVLAAGPLMNFALTIVLFSLLFGVYGLPVDINENSTALGQVAPGYPADRAGFLPGDVILSIDGREVSTWTEVDRAVEEALGRELTFVVRRGSETLTIKVSPTTDPERPDQGIIGVAPTLRYQRVGLGRALYEGVTETWRVLVSWLGSLVALILRRAPLDFAGPVMTVKFIGTTARAGLENLIYLAGFLSLNIGLFNLLPFPALDGGRLTFLAYEGVSGRKVDPRKENLVHFIGFAALILLIILVTYRDILRL